MILKLSEVCNKLPSSLFISGVTGRDEHAVFGGGFGDIYQASYAGRTVAIKRIRTFHRDVAQRHIWLVCLSCLNIEHSTHNVNLCTAILQGGSRLAGTGSSLRTALVWY